ADAWAEGWFDLTAATWADYDSDGDVDILLTGSRHTGEQIEGVAKIYTNDGGLFTDSGETLPAPSPLGSQGGTFTWLDVDGEGDLDYFIAGAYFVPGGNGLIEAQTHLYLNDAVGENEPPSAPAGLTATAGPAGAVSLAWTPATDDTTPAGALTYDLDLRLDGAPVATPRRVPEPGGISAAQGWTLDGLAEGTYTYALRAVDSAFNGGPAAQGTFTVGAVGTEDDGALAFALDPTFPNPFRTETTVRFTLPEPGRVDVAVYDLLGRLVTRLVSEDRAAGVHEVRWDAAGLASGPYVVRLSAGDDTATRRVVLLR
ncbi:MAG TPA: T9SS type A sorting domain-containing protein, partial [Rubricoccaceae bacterium]